MLAYANSWLYTNIYVHYCSRISEDNWKNVQGKIKNNIEAIYKTIVITKYTFTSYSDSFSRLSTNQSFTISLAKHYYQVSIKLYILFLARIHAHTSTCTHIVLMGPTLWPENCLSGIISSKSRQNMKINEHFLIFNKIALNSFVI